jgi:hypothetical protein
MMFAHIHSHNHYFEQHPWITVSLLAFLIALVIWVRLSD